MKARSSIDRKLEAAIAYGDENPEFDITFVESLQKQWKKMQSLSHAQMTALDNIIDKFEIDVPDDAPRAAWDFKPLSELEGEE